MKRFQPASLPMKWETGVGAGKGATITGNLHTPDGKHGNHMVSKRRSVLPPVCVSLG